MWVYEQGILRWVPNDEITTFEPVESIKCVLSWVANTPDAQAYISLHPQNGWSFNAYIQREGSDAEQ